MNSSNKIDFIGENQLQLLHSGTQFFPALLTAFEHAEKEISFETYLFSDDQTAITIKEALCRAAQRGVIVNVIIDWIGTGNQFSTQLKNEFQQSGVNCRVFNTWFKRGLARTHRKLVLIDHQLAFIGGINIIDDNLSDNGSGIQLAYPRWDFVVQIKGPIIERIQKEMDAQWLKLGKLELLQRLNIAHNLRLLRLKQFPQAEHIGQASFIVRDNLRNRNTIRRAYLLALGQAQHRVIIANPYFAPGRKIRNALVSAACRGVNVTLLLGVGAFKLQDAVAQSFYPDLLANGVNIIEYRKTELHAKVAVIDDQWATVGSSNIDGFSLFLNHEANILIKDKNFSKDLITQLEIGMLDGTVVLQDNYKQNPLHKRIGYRIAYIIYKGIMRLATLGQYR